MTTGRTPRKPGSAKGQIRIAADFDSPLLMTSDLSANPPQAEEPKEKKEWPLTSEEQNEIMAQALIDIVGICMMFDNPKVGDLYSIAQRALKAVGRGSESCIVLQK
jgi:hypothetical protein